MIFISALIALATAGTLRPGDRKQWKLSQGSWEIRPSQSWEVKQNSRSTSEVNSGNDNELEKAESTTTIMKSAATSRLATKTYFGYGDSKPIFEESMEIPNEQMRHTDIFATKPIIQWYQLLIFLL